jgi:hypothetical protein
MHSNETTQRTPDEVLVEALADYARAKQGGRNIVVSEWAAVLFVEEFHPDGTLDRSYLHLTSERSTPHGLKGLVGKLSDYVYKLARGSLSPTA